MDAEAEKTRLRLALKSNCPATWQDHAAQLETYLAASDFDAATGLIWDTSDDEQEQP